MVSRFCKPGEACHAFGFSAFTLRDARRAGALVLERGPAVKPANGVGGRGQIVASTSDELDAALAGLGEAEISRHGVVVEQNLASVTTFSIGQVRMSGLRATYYGKQCLTKDGQGLDAYGGSDLVVARGDYEPLLRLVLTPEVRLAIDQARVYDAAAKEFPGFIASRRNYESPRVSTMRGGAGPVCSSSLGKLAAQARRKWMLWKLFGQIRNYALCGRLV